MKKPDMILFDYGHTLLYEPDFNALRGEEALFSYVTENKHNRTPEEIDAFSGRLFAEISAVRRAGCELHERQFQRMLYEYLGIKLSISYDEAEIILWRSMSMGACMPGAEQIIGAVNAMGIRSGVISNIGWSGHALKERLDRLLPTNRFQFVIASSDYGLRKPHPFLFELALRKADLPPENVWFCGDNPRADVEGAAQVGIFPVWYDNAHVRDQKDPSEVAPPQCAHLRIGDWTELIDVLQKL